MKHHFNQFRFWAIGLVTVWLVLFVFMPNVLVVITSFLTRDAVETVTLPVNINSYVRTLDVLYLQVLLDSLRMSFLAMITCLVIGYPFAMCVAQLPKRWQAVMLFLVILPFWTNSRLPPFALRLILGRRGLINTRLLGWGVIGRPRKFLITEFALVFGLSIF